MQVPDTQADVIADKMVDNNQCSSNIKANHANHQNELMCIENQTTHPKEYSIIHIDNDASIKNIKIAFFLGTLFWLECRHLGKHKKSPPYFIFPNFIRNAQEHIYTLISLYHGKSVYFGGDYTFSRAVVTTYSGSV
ncbi:unnamed protein product [Rotaria socialis]|uniref:Uncharacterized protein n=1 Tax=Rotaria socialis TaxID=392032 RepID=A0A820XIL4_9BILA|nr:unnamed protein product [Rotaria socialis]CAF3711789.1 unnamed protein product [Rotaria socialis]CAF4273321.1 unnamed protein product [Rotaria socialis]CAF4530435.1 unnamed protein product [Rotaria socialis]